MGSLQQSLERRTLSQPRIPLRRVACHDEQDGHGA